MYLGFLNPQLMLGGLCSNFGTEFESFALQIHVAKISRSEHFVLSAVRNLMGGDQQEWF